MGGVELVDSVAGPVPADLRDRRDAYWRFLERLHAGLVRYRDGVIYGAGLPLIRLGPARFEDRAWRWPITGGLLASRPGGEIGFGSDDGRLVGFLRGYRPLLPEPLYSLTQRPFHEFVTRLFLLQLRGRRPPPGVPAEPALRIAAAAVDGALVLGVVGLAVRRHRLLGSGLLAAAYFAGGWAVAGRTAGQAAFGLRVTSVDGSPVTVGQALLRLAAAPVAALRRRALHDDLAGTEVVRAR